MSKMNKPDKKPIKQYDHKDGAVGKVGYEINFNRYFYKYQPPCSLTVIEADIRALDLFNMIRFAEVFPEREIVHALSGQLRGSRSQPARFQGWRREDDI